MHACVDSMQEVTDDNRLPMHHSRFPRSQMHTWRSGEALSLKRVTTAVRRLLGRLARGKSAPTTKAAQVNAAILQSSQLPSTPAPSPV